MDRSRPVDRACPLYKRLCSSDYCTRKLVLVDHFRHLLMGCPDPCDLRDEALKAPGARERYRERKAWEESA